MIKVMRYPLTMLMSLFVIAACGGGGEGAGPPAPPAPPPPPALPTISISAAAVTEGDVAGVVIEFLVTASTAAGSDITMSYATQDGTAIAGTDYLSSSGMATIPAGSTSTIIGIDIVSDTNVETAETFSVTLSNVSGNASLGSSTATGTINDDDVAPPPMLSITDASAVEGNSGDTTMSFSLTLSASSIDDVTADYTTVDGSALAPGDYATASGTVTVPAGSTSASIDVSIVTDDVDEADETLEVLLSNVSAGATLAVAFATGTIFNDDSTAAPGMTLNDTGFTLCVSSSGYDQPCNDAGTGSDGFPGQDAENGRDLTANDDSDGHAGFSLTKLNRSGEPLVDQAASYAQFPWGCVADEVTGLTWEVKTDTGDLYDTSWRYSWYNSSGVNDNGDPGVPNNGYCYDNDNCDTEKYVDDVNDDALCGYSDWRLPSRTELLTLMDFSADYQPAIAGWKTAFIDASYFPNTNLERDYWTADTGGAFGKHVVAFDGSASRSEYVFAELSIRLVRGGPQQ